MCLMSTLLFLFLSLLTCAFESNRSYSPTHTGEAIYNRPMTYSTVFCMGYEHTMPLAHVIRVLLQVTTTFARMSLLDSSTYVGIVVGVRYVQ